MQQLLCGISLFMLHCGMEKIFYIAVFDYVIVLGGTSHEMCGFLKTLVS